MLNQSTSDFIKLRKLIQQQSNQKLSEQSDKETESWLKKRVEPTPDPSNKEPEGWLKKRVGPIPDSSNKEPEGWLKKRTGPIPEI
ncbi:hypothetical protein IIQ43_03850 [Acinetobacter oleivorans]|uniref:Uncharacterized protein n=1 Tax=Acinetobacter oleivorans TaxID=1148157 RepID=A0ABR9NFI4_9GAMM|nr:hypothetical protein [Acinetobacter oleivorans]MBE2163670.1 hypothetical protein [Acinetobacter oleivorans]